MSNESVEVQVGRIAERLLILTEEMKYSRDSRNSLHESLDKLNSSVSTLSTRVGNVETSLASAQPTIQEFITIKHKVVGAGALGKWLWIVGAALLGWVAASRETISHLFSNKGL